MFPLPLILKPQPSRWIPLGYLLCVMMAASALLLAEIGWGTRILGVSILTVMAHRQWSRGALPRLRCAVKSGKLEVETEEGWREVQVTEQAVVAPLFILLHGKIETRKRGITLLLAGDSLPMQDFRRLAIWARWRVTPGPP